VIFTGKGTEAFCSGGDQAVRGKHGYVGSDNIGRLNILDVQVISWGYLCLLAALSSSSLIITNLLIKNPTS
jgi:1,4-dihydroxy-2-naphthoyl-CoA synthase